MIGVPLDDGSQLIWLRCPLWSKADMCSAKGHVRSTPGNSNRCGGHFLDYLMAIMTFVEEGQHYP
ncbi:MAG: hypothetical protein WBV43_20865, partial [Pseudolabrys sp.]